MPLSGEKRDDIQDSSHVVKVMVVIKRIKLEEAYS